MLQYRAKILKNTFKINSEYIFKFFFFLFLENVEPGHWAGGHNPYSLWMSRKSNNTINPNHIGVKYPILVFGMGGHVYVLLYP